MPAQQPGGGPRCIPIGGIPIPIIPGREPIIGPPHMPGGVPPAIPIGGMPSGTPIGGRIPGGKLVPAICMTCCAK